MQSFLEYIPYVLIGLSFISNFLSMVYARKTGKSIDREFSMKFRTPDYRENTAAESQKFSPLVTQYRFNSATGQLEELPDKLDIQKLIDSHVDTALENMFERFLPSDKPSEQQLIVDDMRDDLDRLSSAMEAVDEVKEKFGLDEFASLGEVHSALSSKVAEEEAKVAAEKAAENAKQADAALYAQFKKFMEERKNEA